MEVERRCTATTKVGNPCQVPVLPGSPYCLWHDPALEAAERRFQMQSRGGKGKSGAQKAARVIGTLGIAECRAYLSVALESLLEGSMDSSTANAMANVARALVLTVQHGELASRVGELERRAGVEIAP